MDVTLRKSVMYALKEKADDADLGYGLARGTIQYIALSITKFRRVEYKMSTELTYHCLPP